MKESIKLLCALLILSLLGALAHADTITAGYWTTPAKVTSLGIYESTYRVETDTADNTSANCASANGAYWWSSADPSSKEIYSTLMAAQATGKKVKVTYTDECNNSAKKIRFVVMLEY